MILKHLGEVQAAAPALKLHMRTLPGSEAAHAHASRVDCRWTEISSCCFDQQYVSIFQFWDPWLQKAKTHSFVCLGVYEASPECHISM